MSTTSLWVRTILNTAIRADLRRRNERNEMTGENKWNERIERVFVILSFLFEISVNCELRCLRWCEIFQVRTWNFGRSWENRKNELRTAESYAVELWLNRIIDSTYLLFATEIKHDASKENCGGNEESISEQGFKYDQENHLGEERQLLFAVRYVGDIDKAAAGIVDGKWLQSSCWSVFCYFRT